MKKRRGPRLLLWLLLAVLAVTVLPVGLLRFIPPPTSSYMLQSPVKPVRYHWVPHERISKLAGRAVIASEDRSEENTSELQSLMRISYAVFCCKKKKTVKTTH